MPCVCLANTLARRRALRAQKLAQKAQKVQKAPKQPLKSAPKIAAPIAMASTPADKTLLKVPHPRKRIVPEPRVAMPEVTFGHPTVRMTRADLINAESRLGSTIFGPIPAGHRREFFHDKQNIWIWHEDWYDDRRNQHQMTVRYEVRTSGVYKKVSTGAYFKLEGEELENFRKATHAYLYVIKKNLYNKMSKSLKTGNL